MMLAKTPKTCFSKSGMVTINAALAQSNAQTWNKKQSAEKWGSRTCSSLSKLIAGSLEVYNFRQYGQLKSRLEKSRRKKEDQNTSGVTRKKIHMREMLGKSRSAMIFQWFVAPDVRKVGSLKRRARRYLFSREMKIGKPLWREAHFQVKMTKHLRFGAIFEVSMSVSHSGSQLVC